MSRDYLNIQGEPTKAQNCKTYILLLRYIRPLIIILFLTLSTGVQAQLKIDYFMKNGKSAVVSRDYALAIEYFNTIINIHDDLYEAFFLRGVAKFYLEDFIGAESDFDKAIKIKPYYPDAYH